MAYYRILGDVPPKRHTQHRRPDGGLYYEELMGEGHLPSAIVDATPWELPELGTDANHPLQPGTCGCTACFPGEEWKRHDAVTRAAAGTRQPRRVHLLRGRG